jgi:hypothetical protein
MNYRLINGQICSQENAGDSWLPLSKQEANDLLDHIGGVHANDDEPDPFRNYPTENASRRPLEHRRHH